MKRSSDGRLRRIWPILAAPMSFAASGARAEPALLETPASLPFPAIAGGLLILTIMAAFGWSIITTRHLKGSSLFNRLFIIVAVTSAFFSAISSAIGFSLITSQESEDFLRNNILPPAFGVFVFFLAVAIWVGGAEFVRHRDWFRGAGSGFFADIVFFIERSFKIFVVIPFFALILYFVSTWTTVVGIGGVDAVRHTYQFEITRLQGECAGIVAYRQSDLLVREDLRLSIDDVTRVAEGEKEGAQSGARGDGAVTSYFTGIADWYRGLEASVETIIKDDPSGVSPYEPEICQVKIEELRRLLARNAFVNYDAWAGDFESAFDDFASILNRWRHDHRIERFLEQQLASFDRANPRPRQSTGQGVSRSQAIAMGRYASDVKSALETLQRKRKLAKPPILLKSAAELSPARGLDIFYEWFSPAPAPQPPETVSRRRAVVDAEFIPVLSTISPRDAVLKNANIFSDIWALAISWDYAAYILMFAFLFFPSAERAAGFKD